MGKTVCCEGSAFQGRGTGIAGRGDACGDEARRHKIFPELGQKNPGVELLSHTLLCSTIVVRPLIDRVRDGNVS